MTDAHTPAAAALRFRWSLVVDSLTRPYQVTAPMVALFALVPCYFLVARSMRVAALHVPAIALDHAVPLEPAWALVYVSLYPFAILPLLVVRQQEHIRRTVRAYLLVWITALICFIGYPTVAPRPVEVIGSGFSVWVLRFIYQCDPPLNCFPSLHVAHAFVSALTCARVHRGVGIGAALWAALIAVSTLYTKQHYALDVIAGVLLALASSAVFLRNEEIPAADRRLAPLFGLCVLGVLALGIACLWIAYQTSD